MDTCFSRRSNIQVAVVIKIFNNELCSGSTGAIHRNGITSKLACFAINFVVINHQRIVRTRVVTIVSTITLACQQLRHTITINIDQLERMALRERFIDDMFHPMPSRPFALLFQPIETVPMPLTVDDVHLSIIVYVVNNNRKPSIAQLPISMPFPFVVVSVDILKPSVRS